VLIQKVDDAEQLWILLEEDPLLLKGLAHSESQTDAVIPTESVFRRVYLHSEMRAEFLVDLSERRNAVSELGSEAEAVRHLSGLRVGWIAATELILTVAAGLVNFDFRRGPSA